LDGLSTGYTIRVGAAYPATSAKTRILQLRPRQVDHRITVCKVVDLKVFPKPFFDLENHIRVHKVYVYEVYAYEVHAR